MATSRYQLGIAAALSLGLFVPLQASDAHKNLEKNLRMVNPGVSITRISETPVANLVEVEINGSQLIYASADGNHILTGQLIDVSNGQNSNLTERSQQAIREKLLSEMNPATFITYTAEGEVNSEIFVFTDATCGYCKNFHKQIKDINDSGITVHYLAFPREGVNTTASRLLERAWCSETPQATLTEIKASGRSSSTSIPCQAPVESHFRTGLAMGVTGTPYILTKDGRNIGGFLATKDLISTLE